MSARLALHCLESDYVSLLHNTRTHEIAAFDTGIRFLITGRSLRIRYCENNDFVASGAKTKEVAQQRISARIPR